MTDMKKRFWELVMTSENLLSPSVQRHVRVQRARAAWEAEQAEREAAQEAAARLRAENAMRETQKEAAQRAVPRGDTGSNWDDDSRVRFLDVNRMLAGESCCPADWPDWKTQTEPEVVAAILFRREWLKVSESHCPADYWKAADDGDEAKP